jgi:hypothetical protein
LLSAATYLLYIHLRPSGTLGPTQEEADAARPVGRGRGLTLWLSGGGGATTKLLQFTGRLSRWSSADGGEPTNHPPPPKPPLPSGPPPPPPQAPPAQHRQRLIGKDQADSRSLALVDDGKIIMSAHV